MTEPPREHLFEDAGDRPAASAAAGWQVRVRLTDSHHAAWFVRIAVGPVTSGGHWQVRNRTRRRGRAGWAQQYRPIGTAAAGWQLLYRRHAESAYAWKVRGWTHNPDIPLLPPGRHGDGDPAIRDSPGLAGSGVAVTGGRA